MIENFKLKVFRVVADSLNFRRAVEELHLTQLAITSQIKTLEGSLGIALLNGPEPKGPLSQLLDHLRENAAIRRQASMETGVDEGATKSVIATNSSRTFRYKHGKFRLAEAILQTSLFKGGSYGATD